MGSAFRVGLLLCAAAFSISAQTTSSTGASPSSGGSGTTASTGKKVEVYVRPDAKTRQKRYIDSIFGPHSLGEDVALAGFNTWRNSPEEWGPTWEGFGRRVASNVGKGVIRHSIQFGLDEALKLDSHYYRSQDKSISARITNALISPVTARTETGKRTIGVPRLAGTYAASIIAAEAWYPSRYSWKDGVKNGTFSLGFNAAFNLFKEFVWKK
jgi:hypothetical protein